jgi:ChrR-like protein with cupin domain
MIGAGSGREQGARFHKGHREFHTLDMTSGWRTPPGYPDGFKEKIIAGSLDEKNKRGNRTRLLRMEPGTFSTAPFVHDYWEEVFLLAGDLIVGSDAAGKGGEQFRNYTYAVRPPGVYHGPFKSETGCLLLETHYYD